MCDFLIKAFDAVSSDPVKNLRGCYKAGDPVRVEPDGFVWGKEQDPETTTYNPPRFYILSVPGLPVAAGRAVLGPEVVDTGLFEPGGERIFRTNARCLNRFHSELLSQELKNNLRTRGKITMTWGQARVLFRNKTNGNPQ